MECSGWQEEGSSRSLSSEESEVQGRDLSQPEVTRVQVRAHQRTLHDGRVTNVRSHSRGKGKGRTITFSPESATHHKGGFKSKEKESQASKERESLDLSVQSAQRMSRCDLIGNQNVMHSKVLLCFGDSHGIHPGQSHRITHLGSRDSQNWISQCRSSLQELRLEHTGEENQWISQCGQCHGADYDSDKSGQNQDGQCSQNHFGSMNSSQNQDGQCSQCLDHLGSRSSQNQD
eukprot:4619811-Amphidinium_carterae.1